MDVKVEVQGISPLLQHRYSEEAGIGGPGGPDNRPVHSGEKGTPREQAELAAYREEGTGRLYLPGTAMTRAIIDAGRFHKMGKRQATTGSSSMIAGAVVLTELMLPLTDLHGKPLTHFEVDSRRIVNQSTRGARLCHRPRLDVWKTSFTLVCDDTFIKMDLVRLLVDDAGKRIGVGAFRPEKKGPFGRFVVSKWELVKVPTSRAA